MALVGCAARSGAITYTLIATSKLNRVDSQARPADVLLRMQTIPLRGFPNCRHGIEEPRWYNCP
jgi:hypothetical protein